MMRRVSQCAGFTLIELLVVIGIIAVLAALMYPVLATGRRRSGASVCTANLHQLGRAIMMYSADWDGGIPFAPDPCSKHAIGDSTASTDPILRLTARIPYDVRELLRPYGGDLRLYRCPLDRYDWHEPGHKATFFDECGSSYWYDDQVALTSFKLDAYPAPSTNVIMSDYFFYHLGLGPDIDLYTAATSNLLFADMHVKAHSWLDRNRFLDNAP